MQFQLTLNKMQMMKLGGMVEAYNEIISSPTHTKLSFEEKLSILVDKEEFQREQRKFAARMRFAQLRENALLENIDFIKSRNLDREQIQSFQNCEYIKNHQNLIITGPTGVGKTYVGCALLHKACFKGFQVKYTRASKLYEDLNIARIEGRYKQVLINIFRIEVLFIDDFAIAPLTSTMRQDLLEIIEERNGLKTTIIASQLPVDQWHEYIGDPTIADAILDRIVHSSHRVQIKGTTMRKIKSNLTAQQIGL